MISRHVKRHLNAVMLLAAVLALGSGLLLFIEFHVGPGATAQAFAGQSRAFWRNVHRAAAIGFVAALPVHMWVHGPFIKAILKRLPRGLPDRMRHAFRSQLLVLLFSAVVIGTGFLGWAALPHSALWLRASRHVCIDIHNIAGLLMIVSVIHHIVRR